MQNLLTKISLTIKYLQANAKFILNPVAEFHFSTPYYIEGCVVALGTQAGFPNPALLTATTNDKQGNN